MTEQQTSGETRECVEDKQKTSGTAVFSDRERGIRMGDLSGEGGPGMENFDQYNSYENAEESGKVESGTGQMSVSPAPQIEIKLFVGRVPRTWDVDQLRPVFEAYGEVSELVIIRDKVTRQHKGSAFVRMASICYGDAAIAGLNSKRALDASVGLMQVKYAQGELARLGLEQLGETTVSSVKLFVGSIPRNATEAKIKELFEQFGQVEEIHILRNKQTNESKGCCFVKMRFKEQALYAMQKLDGEYTMDGCIRPLEVRFAHNRSMVPGMGAQMPGMAAPGGPMAPSQIAGPMQRASPWCEYFAADGRPYYHNELTNQSTWERPPEFGMMSHGHPMHKPRLDVHALATTNATGPPGSNLFVFHVPNEWKTQDLVDVFSQCGPLVAARIATDKNTRRNKGYAFVSYENKDAAQAAVQQYDGFMIHNKRLKVSLKKGEDFYGKGAKTDEERKSTTSQKSAGTYNAKTPTSGGLSNVPSDFMHNQSYTRSVAPHQFSPMPSSIMGVSSQNGVYSPVNQVQLGAHTGETIGQVSHQSQQGSPYVPSQLQNYGAAVEGANQTYYSSGSNVTSSTHTGYHPMGTMGMQTAQQSGALYSQQRSNVGFVADNAVHSTAGSSSSPTQATPSSAVPSAMNPQFQSYQQYRMSSMNQYQNYGQSPYSSSVQPVSGNFTPPSSHMMSSATTAGQFTPYHPSIAPYTATRNENPQGFDKDRAKERSEHMRKYSTY